jgi:hypothetical protein
VHDIETRIVNATQKPEERERDARALAVMVKTLRELAVLDEERAARRTEVSADDSEPVDLDEFRRELARRMHAFIDQRTGGRVPRDPDEQAE